MNFMKENDFDSFNETVSNMDIQKILIKKGLIFVGIILGILILNPTSCVGATQRGIRFVFGKPHSEILLPGFHLKAPVIGSIKTWSIVPQKLVVEIPITSSGAISRDNQIIGTRIVVYWQYDENKIYEIATNYSVNAIEQLLSSEVNSSMKVVIGTYTIFELAPHLQEIHEQVWGLLRTNLKDRPIKISQVNLSNFDWSSDFDKQINATMEAAQQVKQAEQKANIAEQENRKLLIEAEAAARAQVARAEGDLKEAELKAQAKVVSATAERDAKIAEGEGIRAYNNSIAANMQMEIRFRELEIQLERAKRWNGVDTPTFLPLNPQGGVVTLPMPGKN
jgi:regulator of protease activity HflC (stomatin/prohibitin superfamily)